MARRTLPAIMALILMAIPLTSIFAQDMGPMEAGQPAVVSLSPPEGSMVSGKAWVIPLDTERVVVTVVVWGLEPGASHANMIHGGSCATGGGVVYPLTGLTGNDAGWAAASTVVSTTMATVGTGHFVQAHTGATGGPRLTCGDIAPGMMM